MPIGLFVVSPKNAFVWYRASTRTKLPGRDLLCHNSMALTASKCQRRSSPLSLSLRLMVAGKLWERRVGDFLGFQICHISLMHDGRLHR